MLKTSHRPDVIFTWVSRLCLQGGGVFVQGGTVTLSSCTISGNTAFSVRAHLQPKMGNAMGKMLTCLPRLTLAQLRMLPSTTGGTATETLQSSHSPDGKMADVLAPTHACAVLS